MATIPAVNRDRGQPGKSSIARAEHRERRGRLSSVALTWSGHTTTGTSISPASCTVDMRNS
jgi:hypothetical protein